MIGPGFGAALVGQVMRTMAVGVVVVVAISFAVGWVLRAVLS